MRPLNRESVVAGHSDHAAVKIINGNLRVGGIQQRDFEHGIDDSGHLAVAVGLQRFTQVKLHAQSEKIRIGNHDRLREIHRDAGLRQGTVDGADRRWIVGRIDVSDYWEKRW